MSSPYNPETKRGTEETLEAIARTKTWASRIDTSNDVNDVDISGFINELKEEETKLREEYRVHTTEVAIDNFVFNQEETVKQILCGNLDDKVSAIKDLQSYIADDFGRESTLSLSKEELMWLVAKEVQYHVNSNHGLDAYDEEPFESMNLNSVGEIPDIWSETYPKYNR